jgi:cell wall-associated NlpC family hydrolase
MGIRSTHDISSTDTKPRKIRCRSVSERLQNDQPSLACRLPSGVSTPSAIPMRPNLFVSRAGSPSARLVTAAALLLAAVCATAVFLHASVPASASIASKQDALANVQDQQASVAADLAGSNQEINALIGQVSQARVEEAAAADELAAKQDELDTATSDLKNGRAHLQLVRAQLQRAVKELSQILVGVYKSDDPEMIDLVLESSTWEDASVDASYLDRVHQYQVDTVNKVKDLRAQVEDQVTQLADTKSRIQSARDDLATRHQELADQRASLEAQESQLSAARAARRATLQQLNGRAANLQNGISKAEQRQAAAVPDPASVAAPTVSVPAPNGSTATLNSDGSATAPASAPQQVKDVIAAANAIRDMPYVWGGGHGSFESSGYDCSGAVSYALHGGGFLDAPLDSTGFMSWGEPGVGNWITVYANSGHAYAVIAGLRWDTSDTGGDGPSWAASSSSWEQGLSFTATHPAGF